MAPDGAILYQNESSRHLLGALGTVRNVDPSTLRDLLTSVDRDPQDVDRGGPVVVDRGNRKLQASAIRPGEDMLLLVVRDVTGTLAVEAVRRDLVANASHELKTPVASIRALAETIASAGADRHRRRAEDADLALTVETDGPVLVRGSARDLSLLVRNMVQNAIQCTRAGGAVHVSVGVRDGTAEITVRDTGMGIPAKDQARVFERFYRVDRARSRETGGTGLGLSIVKQVADNHGGTVAVDSLLGRGTTFVVRLPAL